ncbi:MAG: phosphoribosylformylglycinamidine synthase subunit PurL, partial [Planctomycetota bacterium]|nr:phosphoribosylformylglycinamidine synthase subunit PurL [Planctomycetota bacterium]
EVHWREACGADPRAVELQGQLADLLDGCDGGIKVSSLFYLRGEGLGQDQVALAAEHLLSDSVTQECELRDLGDGERLPDPQADGGAGHVATVRKKTGVMEPVEESLLKGLDDLGLSGLSVRLALRVRFQVSLGEEQRALVGEKVLSNPAIEDVFWDETEVPSPFIAAAPYEFSLGEVELSGVDDEGLVQLSIDGQLSLNLDEMRTIRDHFEAQGRPATDIELETIAQTWSEHCCHKTLTARIEHEGPDGEKVTYENLLKDTIARATRELMEKEETPFCLSVFKDNAGVVAFDDEYGISFKVETHNHPSAIEPYGGAGTGIGGVLRDTLGTGLGAKPIVNTDVFCFGPPDLPMDELPAGALHPLRVLRGVVSGVRDYGNRMGIPTASGALYFDERYIGNPLVYCGSIGLIPRGMVEKVVHPGDRVVALGGRTGRDGIHGATFSSVELTEESETVSSGAVQIGNAITEKKFLDVLIKARDLGLYRSVTDCGAGGFSSAVGEMGEETGARVDLEKVPLKYEGLSYWEIWISEAQERMVFAVAPEKYAEFEALAESEGVECTDIGEFTGNGKLELFYDGNQVCDLGVDFLFNGRPPANFSSVFRKPDMEDAEPHGGLSAAALLREILAAPNVASKEWVIRQYDHEVQGRSIIKPLQGPGADGPGDGVVFTPRYDSLRGIAIGCGMNPRYGDIDPYRMAVSAVDEAVRNIVACGGNPSKTAILDNFCWGNTARPETLGSLVEASRGCYDAAMALGTPFVSGKDSLNNEFRTASGTLSIPPSLLISSLSMVEDVSCSVTMDLKESGNLLVLVGETRVEMGGSHYAKFAGGGGDVPCLPPEASQIHQAMHGAIQQRLVRSCHDLSEGGLAVAAAEMAFSGGVGAKIQLEKLPVSAEDAGLDDLQALFSESNCRYLVEVSQENKEAFLAHFDGLPAAVIGETCDDGVLEVTGKDGAGEILSESIEELRTVWKEPLIFDAV